MIKLSRNSIFTLFNDSKKKYHEHQARQRFYTSGKIEYPPLKILFIRKDEDSIHLGRKGDPILEIFYIRKDGDFINLAG